MILRNVTDIVKLVFELKKLKFTKPYEVIYEVYDPTNSNQQKRLYWKWIDIIGKVTGNYKLDQDEMLREIILTPEFYTNARGKDKTYYKRISELGKKEMSEYMSQVLIMAAEYGINLPCPEDIQLNE